METPQFIFDLLERELRTIQINLLEKVSVRYGLNRDDLIADFLPKQLVVVPNSKIVIEVKKCLKPHQIPSAENRCMARVWNRGKGGQCTRNQIKVETTESEYCSQHQKNRKHGRINEPASSEIFPRKSNALYK